MSLQTLLAELSPLEVVAAAASLAGVVLTARQRIVNFPVNIAASALYGVVFWKGRFYPDAVLQLFFIGVCSWDWKQWQRGAAQGDAEVRRTPKAVWLGMAALVVVGTALQGALLWAFTDAVAPVVDSAIFWASVGAQWMIGRRYIENWLVWIAVDAVAAVLYLSKGLPVTSALYALFCGLAVWGWLEWKRSQRAAPPQGVAPPIALP